MNGSGTRRWTLGQSGAGPSEVPGNELADDLGPLVVADGLAEGRPQVASDGDEPSELDVPVGPHMVTVGRGYPIPQTPRLAGISPTQYVGDIPNMTLSWKKG
jgi:hypothetical protein